MELYLDLLLFHVGDVRLLLLFIRYAGKQKQDVLRNPKKDAHVLVFFLQQFRALEW